MVATSLLLKGKNMNNDDVTSFNKPDRTTLDNTDVEALGHAVLTLTHELWVLTDRLVFNVWSCSK